MRFTSTDSHIQIWTNMDDFTFKITFTDGSILVTTVSAVTRFVAEMQIYEMYPNIRWCDFIPH